MDLIQIFTEFWNLKAKNYEHFEVTEIIFNYRLMTTDKKEDKTPILNKPGKVKRTWVNLLKVGFYNFPMTMDLFEWGGVDFVLGDKEAIVYKNNSKAVYHIKFIDQNKKFKEK